MALSLPALVAAGAFVSVAGIALAVWLAIRGRAAGPPPPKPPIALSLTKDRLSPGQARVGAVLESIAAPQAGTARSDLERSLIQANWRGPYDFQIFLGARVVSAVTLPIVLSLIFHPHRMVYWAAVVLFGIAAGYYLPSLVLRFMGNRRKEKLMAAFSDALDMLVSALGAGLGLDAAMQRVGRELRTSAPEFAAELTLVITESAAGIPRSVALQRLDERTGVPEINALVSVLAQAERYGVGVSSAIRAHAQLVRSRRALAAEKRAAEAAPKLTVIMILFILPPLFVIIIGPTVVNVKQIIASRDDR